MTKRAASLSLRPPKKPKITPTSRRKIAQPSIQGKNRSDKTSGKKLVTIPNGDGGGEDVELSDQDYDFLDEFGDAVSFLQHLDHRGIARSNQEIIRLHRLNKPITTTSIHDELPPLESSSEASDDIAPPDSDGSNAEMPYERVPRKSRFSVSPERHVIERLPIKLTDGRLLKTGVKDLPPSRHIVENDVPEKKTSQETHCHKVEDVSTGARFGRPAVLDVVNQTSRRHRIELAKEQIASICQDIMADPESNLGLLKRLHTFSMKEISSPNHPNPVSNDPLIRKLAILSQLAVFKDIIPGYRIRELTEKEAGEKISQVVGHLREWEQGLVVAYQNYLRCLESELEGRTELTETVLKCMCTLLTDLTHFNFRVNLMACIIGQLSRKSWTKMSEMCLDALNSVFRADATGVASLEVVRILNRMIKERRFQIHPNVLSCLLNLRLKSELRIRASDSKADNAGRTGSMRRNGEVGRRLKGKTTDQHLNKKAKKALRERKTIEQELRDAEAVVDKEERATRQTETLKLLFALYFRILKNPTPTPLLPAALHGISKFAHLVNVDFFRDLMAVLKNLISSDSHEDAVISDESSAIERLQLRLLCIVTAFELLSGQGEALNIDLDDFISQLYELILPLGLKPDVDSPSLSVTDKSPRRLNLADLLFDALGFVFSPRTFGMSAPPWRSAAFAKRLLTASLNWSPVLIRRTLGFVGGLISKDPKLGALLSTADRIHDGVYRPEIDDPQLCHPFGTCFWELQIFRNHWDGKVREEVRKILM
ncbi:hypothetical protein AX15_003865 [Amanita polypyramis BW_CC]|nr:hypothetical protein AX15_003865 [Amanita polypyramis BW_CC]